MQGATLPRCCKLEILMLLRFTSLGLGGWDFELVGGLLVLNTHYPSTPIHHHQWAHHRNGSELSDEG